MIQYPKSLVEIAERDIRALIACGDLALGQRVTESELAKRFGMSKTPVREALQHLHREGLVQIRPRQGTFVFTFTDSLLDSLQRVRILLESFALREAARKNRGRFLHNMGKNLEHAAKLVEEKKVIPYIKLDKEFHESFFQHADNPFLAATYGVISIQVQVLWHLALSNSYTADDVKGSLHNHQAIANHILEDDVDGACRVLGEHLAKLMLP